MFTRIAPVLLLLAAGLGACGKDSTAPPDTGADIGADTDVFVDLGQSDSGSLDASNDAGVDMPTGAALCAPCADDASCGGPDDLCLGLPDGERACGRTCDDGLPCPQDFFCALLDEDTGLRQCVPEILTCVDRCSDVTCGANEVCDPLTGSCRRPLRLCETGCTSDALCGQGPDDICLNVPGTPDAERACFTGCNPQAETPECPADYFCGSLDPENAPERGVCFPFDGTCVDRCAAVDCPTGQNCDPVTGQCSAALFGACEAGCTNSVECGGQDDVCLNLGIGDGPHCWQDCTGGECPNGYDCRALLGTTLRVCIPLGNDCSSCDDADCFPSGVCNPVDGTCTALPRTCAMDADCATGELCDPASATCVAIGRPCNGSSWAVDCDNSVTRCTSQRAGAPGTCEQMCATDADCWTGTCRDTNLGRLCLPDDLGGADTCGTLHAANSTVGRPCNPGTCFGSASTCVDDAGLGFCSRVCTSDASCSAGEACVPVFGQTQRHCVAVNCACAGSAALGQLGDAALASALGQLGLDPCSIGFDAESFAAVPDVLDLAATLPRAEQLTANPIAGVAWAQDAGLQLDGATDLADAVRRAAAMAGLTLTPAVRAFSYPGPQGPLAQAIGELVAASGQTPDLAALDGAVASVPAGVQAAAAPVVSAVAQMVGTRRTLLAATWGLTGDAQRLFDAAPWLVLPASAGQMATALDLAVPADRQLVADAAAYSRTLVESADFVGQLPGAINALGALGAPAFPTISVATPAGRVVIAGGGDDTHDIATHGAEIAVLIDLGGNDLYTVPAGANASLASGVSVLLDLGGSDTYSYEIVADPNDGALLPSDAGGRIAPTLPPNQANGPVSASNIARQGAGRLGVGILADVGPGVDTYSSLRMSQGAAIFGLGVLWDDGAATFGAEALAQGAAIGGLGLMWAAGNADNAYTVWHAGQGFAAAGGTGVAYDTAGDDDWVAVPGAAGTVLYLSTADRGVSNRNLAQGCSIGEAAAFGGGLGILRDAAGNDTYAAGTYAQGYARNTAFAAVLDGEGADVWNVRGLGQGVGELRAGGVLVETAGNDLYNQATALRVVGQGTGRTLGFGAFVDLAGDDTVQYLPSGGGVAVDGGFGLAANVGGSDSHSVASDASWGFAQINAIAGEPGFGATTIGIFVDAGGQSDQYTRPTLAGVGDGGVWSTLSTPPTQAIGVDN